MLIVAMPKSASSSLVATASAATCIAVGSAATRHRYLRPSPVPEQYKNLGRIHREIAELTPEAAAALDRRDQFFKHHIVPTKTNRRLLHAMPKVILTRPTEDIIAAYWRGFETNTWVSTFGPLGKCKSLEQWQQTAAEIGLTRELEDFHTGWQSDDGCNLPIEYRDLVADPETVVAKILDFFGLEYIEIPPLEKLNYSRADEIHLPIHKRATFAIKKLMSRISQ